MSVTVLKREVTLPSALYEFLKRIKGSNRAAQMAKRLRSLQAAN